MARPSNKQERRQQIVRAMCELMAEKGYDGATTHELATRSGLSQGLIHYHFKSKLEIVVALIESLQQNLHARFLRLKESRCLSSDPFSEMSAFIDAHLSTGEGADRDAVSCWIVIGAEALRQAEIRDIYRNFCSQQVLLLEEMIDACLIKGSLRLQTVSKRHLALTVMAAIEGSYRLLIAAPQLIDPGFASPTVLMMLKAAIHAEQEC